MSRWIILSLIFIQLGLQMANDGIKNHVLLVEGVSHDLARSRAANIYDIRYELRLELGPGLSQLKGEEEIRLKLAAPADEIVLDFRDLDQNGKVTEGKIGEVKVNDRPISDGQQVNGHLVLPGRYFKTGENKISLDFETGIAASGRPIIRYQDRDDGSEYLYTLFVPMDASLAFPCFDQPDLKARFTLIARTVSDWKVVSNAEVKKTTHLNGEGPDFEWVFNETRPISTYQFAFAAGRFRVIDDGEKDALPLRFYVRQSQLKRSQPHLPEMFRLTRAGLNHYVEFFGHAFPFTKYDQILIPGFAYGGMEHAGATFLREDSILFRTAPTRGDQLARSSLVLHELTHQWFGDLVTMRWFDDLWLKEGFANFMAYHAMATIYDPNESWKRFYHIHKPVAYNIDSTKGTTPIYQEVENLKDAKSAYGAIVYQKAPSLLRSLSFVIGPDQFRAGIRIFLKEHAYANAEWSDLIRAFEKASGQNLTTWAEAWFKQRGMPQIETTWSCDGKGQIESFELKQRDVLDEGGRWPIKTRVLLAYDGAPPLPITTQFDGAQTSVSEAIGKKCPTYVFANDGDLCYGRFLLDERSRQAVIERIDRVEDPLHRAMLWGALWDAVRETEMNPREYVSLVLNQLPRENDEELAQSLLDRLTRAYQRYFSRAQQAAFAPQLEALLFDRMMKAPEQGMRITYFRAFRTVATTNTARRHLKDLLSGKLTAPGVEVKPLDRWRIIISLLIQQDPEADRLLEIERQRDRGDDGRKQVYIAKAARADAIIKRQYFDQYLKDRGVPEDWVEGSLQPFNSPNQSQLTFPYLKPALQALPQMKRERKIFFVLAWLNAFIGGQQSQEAVGQVRDFLRANRIDRDLELKVLEVTDELERTARIRSKYSD
ncbi:MAG TPA: M1 family aminopeptidase [Blastocatellia bacterium]|nr:M1 family aminopeptidase [Blastocatellia bacterium]